MSRAGGVFLAALAVASLAICTGACSRVDVRLGTLRVSDTGLPPGFDAGPRDSGLCDAGFDAGTSMDAGAPDTGIVFADSGPSDVPRGCVMSATMPLRFCSDCDAGMSEMRIAACHETETECFVYGSICTDEFFVQCTVANYGVYPTLRDRCIDFCNAFRGEDWATACDDVPAM